MIRVSFSYSEELYYSETMFNACEKKMKLLKVIKINSHPSTYE